MVRRQAPLKSEASTTPDSTRIPGAQTNPDWWQDPQVATNIRSWTTADSDCYSTSLLHTTILELRDGLEKGRGADPTTLKWFEALYHTTLELENAKSELKTGPPEPTAENIASSADPLRALAALDRGKWIPLLMEAYDAEQGSKARSLLETLGDHALDDWAERRGDNCWTEFKHSRSQADSIIACTLQNDYNLEGHPFYKQASAFITQKFRPPLRLLIVHGPEAKGESSETRPACLESALKP